MATKYLIQRFTEQGIGRIFLATENLLSRADMQPYDGPVPENMIVKIGEAMLQQPAQASYKMDFETGAVTETKAETTGEIQADETTTTAAATPLLTPTSVDDDPPMPDLDDVPPPIPAVPVLSPDAKIDKIVQILGNPTIFPVDDEHYTGQGIPRIDALIHALGTDVQAAERMKAFEIHKKNKK
jgi:hypothetical protein